MEAVIREGALRLASTETCCDVILSCHGNRLMAHKLILSMASPVLRDLLLTDGAASDPAVLILPDINYTTMSSILDYIYTGSVIIYSNLIDDFVSVAELLKIYIDMTYIKRSDYVQKKEEKAELKNDVIKVDGCAKKSLRKVPNLVPIHVQRNKTRRKLCAQVIPCPWTPRIQSVLEDPRRDYMFNIDHQPHLKAAVENDSNNNFQLSHVPIYYSNKPNLHPLYHKDETTKSSDLTTPIIIEKPFVNRIENLNETSNQESCSAPPSALSPKSSTSSESVVEENLAEVANYEKLVDDKCDRQKPFKCDECGKCFSQLRNYKYHRSVHEGTKEFAAKCPECDKVFNDRGYLSSHMKIHRDRKEYACPHCPKRFNQRVAYNMHLRIHTGVKPHECTVCGKHFSRKMLLKQHQRVHTGERPYSCPECGKTFADRSNMSLHARLHTGVKPYACSLCPKSFTKKHHLKTHMNFHTGLKPYSCEKCGLAFSQSSNMRTHYKKCILKETSATFQSDLTTSQQLDKSV